MEIDDFILILDVSCPDFETSTKTLSVLSKLASTTGSNSSPCPFKNRENKFFP